MDQAPRVPGSAGLRSARLRATLGRPAVRVVLRRLQFAVLFDVTLGAYLTGVGFTLLQLGQDRSFDGKALFAAYWSVLFVGLYYVVLLYGPVLLLAAYLARRRPFGTALPIRLVAFALPASVLIGEAVVDFGPRGAFDLMWDTVGVPLLAGLLSTAAAEVALHALPPEESAGGTR